MTGRDENFVSWTSVHEIICEYLYIIIIVVNLDVSMKV